MGEQSNDIDINKLKSKLNELEKDTRKSIDNDNSDKEYYLGYYQAIRDILKLIR